MQEKPENSPDDSASFQSIYKAISNSFDKSNPYHQNFIRCLDFIASEEKPDKAEDKIPEEIKTMICEAVQEILKETEPEFDDPKLNPDGHSEPKRTKFSQELENKWLPNLPKFMAVVPKQKLKPKPIIVTVQHEKTTQPLSPKESAISPKQPSENPSASIKQPDRRASVSVKKQLDRPASVPVKNKVKGFFSRSSKSKPQEEKNEDTRKNQSKSL